MKNTVLICLGFLLIALLATKSAYATDNAAFTPQQQTAIQTIVHDYLIKNPNVILEAVQSLQQKAHAAMVQKAQQVINTQSPILFNDPNSPVAGNPKAPISVVEFFDYQCPYCKRIAPAINQLTKENPQVRVVYKELPIFGDSSVFAAQAALAAEKQNKYLPFHLALMEAKPPFSSQQILTIAKSVGIDINQLQTDMKNQAITSEIKSNIALANQMQLIGTPAFVVAKIAMNGNTINKPSNSLFIPGAISPEELQKAIHHIQQGQP